MSGRLDELIAAERAALLELQDENCRIRQELTLIQSSSGRRLLLRGHARLTRVLSAVRHPIWAAGTAVRLAGSSRWPTALRSIHQRLRRSRTLLRFLPIASQQTTLDDPDAAIRWIGPLRVGGETREALLCHPDSTAAYHLRAPLGARVVAHCALAPAAWPENRGGIEFELAVSVEQGGWSRRRALRLDPAARWGDRRWRRLMVDLPPGGGGEIEDVVIVLATRVPPGAPAAGGWALWGEPLVEWRRPAEETLRSVRSFAGRVRAAGLRAALRQLRTVQTAEAQAALYRRWVEQHAPRQEDLARMEAEAAALPWRPRISIVTPVYDTRPRWLRACIESVRRQVYPDWELCLCDDASPSKETVQVLREYEGDPRIRTTYLGWNAGISAASNAALATATGEFVGFLDHDDELAPEALYQVARHLNAHPDADLIYSDEDKLDTTGERCDPYFKPGWSPEHFLACMYTCHFMVVRRSPLEEIGGFRPGYDGSQDYDLVLRLSERTDRIHHLPGILYHWRKLPQSAGSTGTAKPWALDAGRRALEDAVGRRGLDASVLPGSAPGLFRVRRRIRGTPLVSIVIPTLGSAGLQAGRAAAARSRRLTTCLRSLARKTAYPEYEVLIVADGGEIPGAALKALAGVRHRVIAYDRPGPFNFSHKINFGVARASGDHLVLFNDDLEVITPEWLSAMLEYSQDEAIGAVGAKLLYPDGRVQHVGMLVGVCGVAAHAFHQHPGFTVGYASSAIIPRNCSAVTAACMMTRREVFERAGGFNEDLAVDFNDVDYCLRVRRAGYRIVFTPYAQLYHHESASFGPRLQNPAEIEKMRRIWGAELERDPYYNPHLTREFPDYRLDVRPRVEVARSDAGTREDA